MVLSYLRSDEVWIGRQQIVSTDEALAVIADNPPLNNFIHYFDEQWMSRIEQWNSFALADHLTNNDVEGWHYQFNKHLTKYGRALGFWQFVEMIGNRVTVDDESFLQLTAGHQLATRSGRSIAKENNIARMKALYISGDIAITGGGVGICENCVRAYIRGLEINF